MIFSAISPLATNLAKPRAGSVALRAGLSTRGAQVDPTKIHLYKRNADEHEKWQHTPFAEREMELPRRDPQPKVPKTSNGPYYRKFQSSGHKKNAEFSGGMSARSGAGGSKMSSL